MSHFGLLLHCYNYPEVACWGGLTITKKKQKTQVCPTRLMTDGDSIGYLRGGLWRYVMEKVHPQLVFSHGLLPYRLVFVG